MEKKHFFRPKNRLKILSVKGKKCFCTDSFFAYMLKGQKQRGKGVDNNILAKKSHGKVMVLKRFDLQNATLPAGSNSIYPIRMLERDTHDKRKACVLYL